MRVTLHESEMDRPDFHGKVGRSRRERREANVRTFRERVKSRLAEVQSGVKDRTGKGQGGPPLATTLGPLGCQRVRTERHLRTVRRSGRP